MVTIKAATKNQLPIIIAIAHQVWPGTYDPIVAPGQTAFMLQTFYTETALSALMDKGHFFDIAWLEEKPLGFVSYSLEANNKVKLNKLYVIESAQGLGIGHQLLLAVVAYAKEQSAHHIFLHVNKHNKAQFFYSNKGFKIVEALKVDIGHGYIMDDYIMQLDM